MFRFLTFTFDNSITSQFFGQWHATHTHTLTIVRIDIFANYGVCDIRSKIRTKALWQQSALSLRVNKFFFVLDFFRKVLMIFIHSQARPIDFHCFCMHFVCDSLVSGSKTFLRNFLMHCAHEKCVDFYFGLKQWMCLGFDFLHFTSSGLTKFAFSRWQWKMRNHDLWSPTVSPLFDQTADGF